MTADPAPSLRSQEHPQCVACSPDHPFGLRLTFEPADDGSVTAEVDCAPPWQGYTGLIQGGVVSMMLDAAMTNCLFQRGVTALTAKLSVRFLEPVRVGRTGFLSARIVRSAGRGYILEATLRQDGRPVATAEAVFMRKPPAR